MGQPRCVFVSQIGRALTSNLKEDHLLCPLLSASCGFRLDAVCYTTYTPDTSDTQPNLTPNAVCIGTNKRAIRRDDNANSAEYDIPYYYYSRILCSISRTSFCAPTTILFSSPDIPRSLPVLHAKKNVGPMQACPAKTFAN